MTEELRNEKIKYKSRKKEENEVQHNWYIPDKIKVGCCNEGSAGKDILT